MAVPAAKLFIVEMSCAIASAPTNGQVSLSPSLREELVHWRFLEGEGSKKSPELTRATKDLFFVLSARNVQLNLVYIPLAQNMADGPSRQLSTILANNVGRLGYFWKHFQ